MKIHGVASATADFSGGGDSGEVGDVDFRGNNGERVRIDDTKLTWATKSSRHIDGKWVEVREEESMTPEEIVRQLCNDALDDMGMDWYNNEGGQGSLEIDFTTIPPAITLNVGINEQITHDYSFDYTDGEKNELED